MAIATVAALRPGDKVTREDRWAVFITCCPHPIWEGLRLVIWSMDDGTLSLDALRADQGAGEVEPIEPGARAVRLRNVLMHVPNGAETGP